MNLPATIYEENSGKVFEMQPQYIFLELQHLSERYEDVYGKLHYTISDVDSLRRENLLLVCEHLELLSLAEEQDTDITPSSFSIVDDLGSKLEHTNHEMERGISIRSVLPKSISIRSSGFIGARRQPPHGVNLGSSTRRRDRHRLRLLATPALQVREAQLLFIISAIQPMHSVRLVFDFFLIWRGTVVERRGKWKWRRSARGRRRRSSATSGMEWAAVRTPSDATSLTAFMSYARSFDTHGTKRRSAGCSTPAVPTATAATSATPPSRDHRAFLNPSG